MAEQPQIESTEQTTSTTSPATVSAAPSVQSHQVQPVVIKQSGGKIVGTGALVLALIALGASGLLFVQGQNTLKNLETSVAQQLNQAKVGEVDAVQLVKQIQQQQDGSQKQLLQLQQDNQRFATELSQTNQAYQQLVKSRHQWLVDEIEFSLNVATQQLLLTGNKEATIKSLKSIENRLNQFDKPELLPLKQAISSDLIALNQGASNVNITSTAVMISSLENRVDGLKTILAGELTKPEVMAAASNPQLSWWENVWNAIQQSFRGLVEVRKLDNKDAMLISPEQAEYLQENLRLHLIAARIALMQQQNELYKNELQTIDAAVRRYYDLTDPVTKAWLADLAQVQQIQLGGNPSEALKNSLLAVQQFQQQQNQLDGGIIDLPTAASAPVEQALPPAPASQPQATSPTPVKPQAASDVQGGRA